MRKEQLIQQIRELRLEPQIEGSIVRIILEAKEVNDTLLGVIADILDMQAKYYNQTADVIDDIADEYEALGLELDALKDKEYVDQLEAIKENREKLTNDLTNKLNEMQGKLKESKENKTKIEEITNTLKQRITAPAV